MSPEEMKESGITEPPPRTTDEFVEAFKETDLWRDIQSQMQDLTYRGQWEPFQKQEFVNNWMLSMWLCLRRQALIFSRDKVFMRSRILQVIVMGTMAGEYRYPAVKETMCLHVYW